MSTSIPVWLDCDPGHDDAFAILIAAYHKDIHLIGVSTVYGNAPLSKTTNNALSVLRSIGKNDIPVYPGVQKPFSRPQKHAPTIHGESGLDGTDLLPQPDRPALTHCNAIKEMRDSLMSYPPRTAWLVATGTLTNVGLMFAVFPEVVSHIKGLSIMGGAVGGDYAGVYMGPSFQDADGVEQARIGNLSPYAEFNIWCDPEAAKSIFDNVELAAKTTLITLDLTHQVCAVKEVRDTLLFSKQNRNPPTVLRRMFNELLVFFTKTYQDVFGLVDGPPLHDPLAVVVVLDTISEGSTQLFDDNHRERWQITIITEGEQTGRTVLSPAKEGVFVPRAVDLSGFWNLVEECMEKADKATGYIATNDTMS